MSATSGGNGEVAGVDAGRRRELGRRRIRETATKWGEGFGGEVMAGERETAG